MQECHRATHDLELPSTPLIEEPVINSSDLFGMIITWNWQIKRIIQKTGNSINKRIKALRKKTLSYSKNKQIIDFDCDVDRSSGSDKSKVIGIYNDSWEFKGGGECHALSFVSALEKKGTVYLIAETDFNVNEIENHFQIDLSRCRKLIINNFDTSHTKHFNIFINACHKSNLNSLAETSLYIVNFPHRRISKALVTSYFFLFNSEYTKKWAYKFWGNHVKGDIFYPVRMLQYKINDHTCKKQKYVLSVGRFFNGGHCKNQLIIAQVFKKIMSNNPSMTGWKLVLAGGLDTKSMPHALYFEKITTEAKGWNIEVAPNVDRKKLDNLFQQSAFYVHAAGLGQNEDLHPENFEHFGITVLEATLSGCIPIVYNVAGPAEIVGRLGGGYTYDSESSMYQVLLNMMQKFDTDNEELQTESSTIAENSRSFVRQESQKEIPVFQSL